MWWMCFNPSIGLTSVPTVPADAWTDITLPVSIPQSGLQAFRLDETRKNAIERCQFQSLNRAYKRSDDHDRGVLPVACRVSIPQSGLQAFRPRLRDHRTDRSCCFNPSIGLTSVPTPFKRWIRHLKCCVSIPQSGLQAFRLTAERWRLAHLRCFNPSIGLTSVPTASWFAGGSVTLKFQSLNRAYKRSDQYSPSARSHTTIAFQSLNRAYKRSDIVILFVLLIRLSRFNPSIGLTSVPTLTTHAPSSSLLGFQSLNRAYKRSDSSW